MQQTAFEQIWYRTPLGRYAAGQEQAFFAAVLPAAHGELAVQIGVSGQQYLDDSKVRDKLYVSALVGADMRALPHALPLRDNTADVVLLPHTLELSDYPHQVLREVYRVLRPEGRLVLTGFNPHSLWTFSRGWYGRVLPSRQDCLHLNRLKDWLNVLGMVVQQGQFMCYAPACQNEQRLRRFGFLDAMGNRWWPQAAAVYGLVAVKRVVYLRPLPKQKTQRIRQKTPVWNPAKISDVT